MEHRKTRKNTNVQAKAWENSRRKRRFHYQLSTLNSSVAADLQSDAKYYKDFQSEYNNPYLITRREIPHN